MKLVICDIDGTLVGKDEQIGCELRSVVDCLKQKGIAFSVATGRTFESARPFVNALVTDTPYVINNGATVMLGNQCIYSEHFNLVELSPVLEYADSLGVTVAAADTYHEMPMSCNKHVLEQQKKGRMMYLLDRCELRNPDGCYHKVMIYDYSHTAKTELIYDMLQPYMDKYCVTYYPNQAVELAPKACTKATGIQKVAEHMNISLKDMLVCGDDVNDIEMIQMAGIGVAVANAKEKVKQVADYIATQERSWGIVEAIEALVLNSQRT